MQVGQLLFPQEQEADQGASRAQEVLQALQTARSAQGDEINGAVNIRVLAVSHLGALYNGRYTT